MRPLAEVDKHAVALQVRAFLAVSITSVLGTSAYTFVSLERLLR